MGVVNSLPPRPLRPDELTDLNRSESLELAVSVAETDTAESLILATASWVKGLHFDGEGWRLVKTVTLDDETRRVDGLQACEEAILDVQADDEASNAPPGA